MTGFNLSGVSLRETRHGGRSAFEVRMPSAAYQAPDEEQLTDRTLMA